MRKSGLMIWNGIEIPDEKPVLIAGPTASGKSALALKIAESGGGAIINADAIQVFANWRVLTARPSAEDENRVPHHLFGHIPFDGGYSVGHWLREVDPLLSGDARPIIVGGTGLYFTALTQGLVDIPQIPAAIRLKANDLLHSKGLEAMTGQLDEATRQHIDTLNPMRVQRAWEVLHHTGRGLVDWQRETPAPLLSLDQTVPLLLNASKTWLTDRINRRFDLMLEEGALDEAQANLASWNPDHLSSKAIGAPELIAYLKGDLTLDAAREAATVSTRQFAKRQRTWFRARMKNWHQLTPENF